MIAALIFLFLLSLLLSGAVWWRLNTMRRRDRAPDVIFLGYDDQDKVTSMRETMLERMARGDLDNP